MLFLERRPRQGFAPDPAIRSSAGGSGLFLSAANRCASTGLPRHDPVRPVSRVLPAHAFNAPTHHPGLFRPVFTSPNPPEFRANKPCHPCLNRRTEWSFWNPFGSDRRDPNTLAPNGPKTRPTPCARQGLVRVPESNTKYGGKWGKQGCSPRLLTGASISESSGIPKRKNLFLGVGNFDCAPLFTGATIYCSACLGLHFGDSRKATVSAGQAIPAGRWLQPRE